MNTETSGEPGSRAHSTLYYMRSCLAPARCRKVASRLLVALLLLATALTTSPGAPLQVLLVEIGGILLVIVGVLGRIWCSLYIAGRKNSELCTDGPYSLCRNPLYLFSFLAFIGLLLAARLHLLALIVSPLFWCFHYFVIRSEERSLSGLFGESYEKYRQSVPRIWPRASGYWSRTILPVDARLMARALSEVAWFLLALACFEVVEHLRGAFLGDGQLPVLFTWPF